MLCVCFDLNWSVTACNHNSALCMKILIFFPSAPPPPPPPPPTPSSFVSKCSQLRQDTVQCGMPACSITYQSGLQWLQAARVGSFNYSTVGGSRTADICLPQLVVLDMFGFWANSHCKINLQWNPLRTKCLEDPSTFVVVVIIVFLSFFL